MRSLVALIVLSMSASLGLAFAQTEPAARAPGATASQEPPEEVVVRGRRLGELRSEAEDARERAYGLFNDLNSNDDFDVHCHKESRGGTNVPQEVCRAQFENRMSSAAAKDYFSSLFLSCPGSLGITQDCMFSAQAQGAISRMQGAQSVLPSMQDQMTDEIFRLARENDEFAQAILDWYEASQQYDAARKRRKD